MTNTAERTDWYERRTELRPGMVFDSCWGVVRLDARTPGDGTDWDCDVWYDPRPDFPGYEIGHWSAERMQVNPGELTVRLADDYAGEPL